MRDNLLLRLPQELGCLKELHVLDVSGNRYQAVGVFPARLVLSLYTVSVIIDVHVATACLMDHLK